MIEKRWITTLTYQQSTNHAEDYRLFFFDSLDCNISSMKVLRSAYVDGNLSWKHQTGSRSIGISE